MELSCKSQYALLALLELATHYEDAEPMQIRQIAAGQNIPDRYLEQLLATLRRSHLVRSQRGARGGYLLAIEPWHITLFDVVRCIEGFDGEANAKDCQSQTVEGTVVGEIWQEVRETAYSVLQKYTIQDLRERRDERNQLNLMYYI
ncbi:Rrf2 family transcriptional regulator [Geitlerinema sp. PCC 9228]|uniref:RrF2 family transcriptional regulator n=1 Tax=Geitlerinema sp. PCC 9228 TaxID=111611 RepID=UPI0008F9AD0F|nr:Rrf2 family transcriptional regulator [Geitlerinema sp. PCC 9228]